MRPSQEIDRAWTGNGENTEANDHLSLADGSRVAVIGGGPAGSFFCWFLLEEARRLDLTVDIDLFEPHDYSKPGPAGCNHCGGIVSETLVQILAAEGINLPDSVVQRGIDSYTLHTEEGQVRIETPLREKRIAAVSRGAGPRGTTEVKWGSFDGFLQSLAIERGVRVVRERVADLDWDGDRPRLSTREGFSGSYDLVAVAAGINANILKTLQEKVQGFQVPASTKTYICEIPLGGDVVDKCIGSSMHVFLPKLAWLEFAAVIPKGDHVTMCLLGEDLDADKISTFLHSDLFRQCMPPEWVEKNRMCLCWPRINVRGGRPPVADRIVFIGDSLVTRLYKDGIGGAYRTAKAAANAAVFHGVSAEDFRDYYWPVCRSLERDNAFGKLLFAMSHQIRGFSWLRRALLRMTRREQEPGIRARRMSLILWDLFTGSAPYRDIFLRFFHPVFSAGFAWNAILTILGMNPRSSKGELYEVGNARESVSGGGDHSASG
jgi:flavin-dependent dehydrogenase